MPSSAWPTRSPSTSSASTFAFDVYSWRPVNSVGPCVSTSSRKTSSGATSRGAGFGRVGAGPHALLLHALLEPGEVDLAAALARDLAGEIDREPERVVQEEGVVAGDVLLVDDLGEHVDAALQRGAERLLFALDDLAHDLVRRRELRVRVAHRGDDLVDDRRAARRRARRAGTRAAPRGG